MRLNDTVKLTESSNVNDELVNKYLINDLEPIRKIFKRINSIQKWTSIERRDLWEATEGDQVVFYYSGETLEKLIVRHFGETFQYIGEYYLSNGELSFVFEKSYQYNRPIYWDSSSIDETRDPAVFDFEEAEIIEDRSYFIKNEIVHQLNNQDCGSPFADDYLTEEQVRIQTEFKRFLELKNLVPSEQ